MAAEDREELVKLLNLLNSAHLIVPDELTKNILGKSGVGHTDPRTVKLVSLATQKFVHDIVKEARNVQENRSQASQKHQQSEGLYIRDKKRVLITTEDVAEAFRRKDYGIKINRPGVLLTDSTEVVPTIGN